MEKTAKIIKFLEKMLSLIEKSPSERATNAKVSNLRDEHLKCAKSYNSNYNKLK